MLLEQNNTYEHLFLLNYTEIYQHFNGLKCFSVCVDSVLNWEQIPMFLKKGIIGF